MLVRQLLNPTDAQLERATRVLFETVGYDELPLAGCGFDRSILWDNFYARVSYGCRDGWVYVIGKDEDSIDGVAYINAAGSSYGDSPSSPGGPPKFRERVRPEIKEWHQAFYFPWFDSFCNRAFDDLGISMKGSLYVNLLGVDPSIQGKGYGYALMKKMLELAKEQKVDLTLISDLEKNTRWYERLGLEVTIRDDVDVWEIGSRPCWGMVKRYKE